MTIDLPSAVVALAFPLVLYAFLRAYVHSTMDASVGERMTAEQPPEWEAAIMPYAPLPLPSNKNAYFVDDLTMSEWTSKLEQLTDVLSFKASTANGGWVEAATFGYSKVALDACMQAVASKLNMPVAKVAVKSVKARAASMQARGMPDDVRAWDVVACFHRSGRARGWCATLTVAVDYRPDSVQDWVFGVVAAAPGGVISEAMLLLRPS